MHLPADRRAFIGKSVCTNANSPDNQPLCAFTLCGFVAVENGTRENQVFTVYCFAVLGYAFFTGEIFLFSMFYL